MKKLSEYKNEEAIDLLADLLEPITKILGDKAISSAVKGKKSKMEIVKVVLKSHQKEVVEVLAILNGVSAEEYDANLPQMTMSLLELLNDKDLIDFFTSQAQMASETSSPLPMESTEESEQ